jgi:hypothetical protein
MPTRRLVRVLSSLGLAVLLLAPSARGELAAWDQAKVTGIAKGLATATDALYETFVQQPPPKRESMQSDSYNKLGFLVSMLRTNTGLLVKSLENGDGREQTVWIYEVLTSYARSARSEARTVFITKDVGERAAAVRRVLNDLGPYYDPDFETLAPLPSSEPGATR